MSSVYRAHDRLLERDVALKVLHEQFTADADYVERFRREARSVAQLSHPNIVTVIDRGEQDDRQFIVFEYVAGENLKTLVEREGPLPEDEAVAADAADRAGARLRARARARPPRRQAAERAPERGRPGEGDRLRDRALARRQGRADADRHRDGHERLHRARAGARLARRRTERHLLARRRALRAADRRGAVPGDNFVAVAMRHINEPPPSVRERRPDVSPRLDAAIRRAMAKEPRDRFASMDELCAELSACLGPETATSGARDDGRLAAEAPTPAAARAAPARGSPQHLAADPAARRADGARRDPRGGLRVHGLRQRALDARRQEEDDHGGVARRSTSRARRRTTRTATRPSTTRRRATRSTATPPRTGTPSTTPAA